MSMISKMGCTIRHRVYSDRKEGNRLGLDVADGGRLFGTGLVRSGRTRVGEGLVGGEEEDFLDVGLCTATEEV